MSPAEETALWWLILAASWALASALVLGIDGPEEWSRVGAWSWAVFFVAASLVAAYFFWRLL
jgi:hypothetical protein